MAADRYCLVSSPSLGGCGLPRPLCVGRWSCDEGYHWKNYTFTNGTANEINVVRMFTEYGEESQHATIFGYHSLNNWNDFRWLVIDLDFTVLNISKCGQNDYYKWSPTDEVSNSENRVHIVICC